MSNSLDKKWVLSIFDYLWKMIIIPISNNEKAEITQFKWAGGRFTGKTVQVIHLAILLHLLRPDLKICFYGMRKMISNKKEFFNTILQWMPDIMIKNLKTNQSQSTIRHGNLYMELIGLHAHKTEIIEKLGKTRRKSDVQINCFDEAFEFSKKDFLNIKAGTGQAPISLFFWLSNPFSRSAPYIEEFERFLPYDLEKMKQFGHYWKILNVRNKPTLFHWSCAYAIWNEGILNDANKEIIENAVADDPQIGAVVEFGQPMNLTGGIYASQLDYLKIEDSINFHKWRDAEIIIGIDFGYSVDPTVCMISLVSNDRTSVFVIDELYISPLQIRFDINMYIVKIFNFISKWHDKLLWKEKLNVICDNDFAFVDNLNAFLAKFKTNWKDSPLSNYIHFYRISEIYQKDRIAIRVKTLLRCIANGKLHVLNLNVPNFIKELNLAKWAIDLNNKNKKVREDTNNHCLDALEYSLSPFLLTIGRV